MNKKEDSQVFYAVSFALQLGFLTAIPIVLFILLGLWADKFFGTRPFLIIAAALIGICAAIYESYHFLSPLIKNKSKND